MRKLTEKALVWYRVVSLNSESFHCLLTLKGKTNEESLFRSPPKSGQTGGKPRKNNHIKQWYKNKTIKVQYFCFLLP